MPIYISSNLKFPKNWRLNLKLQRDPEYQKLLMRREALMLGTPEFEAIDEKMRQHIEIHYAHLVVKE